MTSLTGLVMVCLTISVGVYAGDSPCACSVDNRENRYTCVKCGDSFPDIDNPDQVRQLIMTNNSITEVTEIAFTNLEYLDLSFNKITEIKDGAFKNCKLLTEIKINHNQIYEISNQNFIGPEHMKVLDLSFNRLANVKDEDVFNVFKNSLQSLDISHNHIKSFNPMVLSNMRGLKHLDLSFNDINQTHEIRVDGLTSLEYLNLGHNGLVFIHKEAFKDMNQLKTLDLSHNKLADIEAQAFHGLDRNLTTLFLNNNKLERFDNFFIDLHELKELYLDYNDINVVTASALGQNLEVFSMCNTQVTVIPSQFFGGVRNLKRVRICNNPKLVVINQQTFDDMGRAVPEVDFSNNDLSSLSEHLLKWENVTKLNIDKNPWKCDCRLTWVNNTLPLVAKTMECAFPEDAVGKKLSEVTADPKDCLPRRRPSHHYLFVSFTVLLVMTLIIVMTMCIIWIYGRSARKYMKMQNQRRGGAMQYNSGGGSVQYNDNIQSAAEPQSEYRDDARAPQSMFPYKDLKEHTRDGDDTLFSIDDKEY